MDFETEEIKDDVTDEIIENLHEVICRRDENEDVVPEPKDDGTEQVTVGLLVTAIVKAQRGNLDEEVVRSLLENTNVADDSKALFDIVTSEELRDLLRFFADEGPMPDLFWEVTAQKPDLREMSFEEIGQFIGMPPQSVGREIDALDDRSDLIDVVECDREAGTVVLRLDPEMEEKMANSIAESIALGAEDKNPPVDLSDGSPLGERVDSNLDFETAILYAKGTGANRTVNQLEMLRSTFVKEPGPSIEALREHLFSQLEYPIIRRLEEQPSAREIAKEHVAAE